MIKNNFLIPLFSFVILFGCTQKVSTETIDLLTNENQQLITEFQVKLEYKNQILEAIENSTADFLKSLTHIQRKKLLKDNYYISNSKLIDNKISSLVTEYTHIIDSLDIIISVNTKFIEQLGVIYIPKDEIYQNWKTRMNTANKYLTQCNIYQNSLMKFKKEHYKLIQKTEKALLNLNN